GRRAALCAIHRSEESNDSRRSLTNSDSCLLTPKNRMSDPIREILEQGKTLAVVGLSSKIMRPSHGVADYMQRHGYRIIPVNPNEEAVLGEKGYSSVDAVPEA